MSNPKKERNWAEEVPWERPVKGQYHDYGWERHQSVLPEFRDPDVHYMDYERDEVENWRRDQGRGRPTSEDWVFRQRNRRKQSSRSAMQRGPHTGKGPQGYKRSDDRIFEDICERLTMHGQVDARDIRVEVKNGEVTFQGEVDSRWARREVENIADSVTGVKDVNNQLKVNTERHMNWTDRTGRSNVWPASGPMPNRDAEVQGMASWGQGERGAKGYEDHGESELSIDDDI